MSAAVKIPGIKAVYFINQRPLDAEGIEVEDDAWVEIAPNINTWPEGTRRPEQVLCRSRNDPKHYKMFKYHDEVDHSEWEVTGLQFGGTFSAWSWSRFAEKMPALRSLLAFPDEGGD